MRRGQAGEFDEDVEQVALVLARLERADGHEAGGRHGRPTRLSGGAG